MPLRRWKTSDAVQRGPEELMQPGERKVGLRLDAGGGHDQHVAIAGNAPRRFEQRGLPDPGDAFHDERRAATIDLVQQGDDMRELVIAP